jgi:lipopolysaccharide export system permease protein
MKNRLLERYLAREVLMAWLAVIAVLLAIMLATRFASFLSMAAKGQLPRDLLFEVVALSSLRFMVILMPVSLLLAVMLSLGRLYSDNEVAAMTGCGVGLGELYRPFVKIAAMLAVFTATLSFFFGPWAGREADFLVKDARRLMQYTPFEPGRFKSVAGDRAVFYTASIDKTGAELGPVFAQIQGREGPSVVAAPQGHQTIDPATGDRVVTLENGYRYDGQPGTANFDVVKFHQLEVHVAPPPFTYVNDQRKLAATEDLVGTGSREDRAELEFRGAMPVSVLILALLAVPMSHLAPRQGRYAKIAYGIVAYLVYANLITLVQNAIAKGHAPALSLWGIHAVVLSIALAMIGKRNGWWRRA